MQRICVVLDSAGPGIKTLVTTLLRGVGFYACDVMQPLHSDAARHFGVDAAAFTRAAADEFDAERPFGSMRLSPRQMLAQVNQQVVARELGPFDYARMAAAECFAKGGLFSVITGVSSDHEVQAIQSVFNTVVVLRLSLGEDKGDPRFRLSETDSTFLVSVAENDLEETLGRVVEVLDPFAGSAAESLARG